MYPDFAISRKTLDIRGLQTFKEETFRSLGIDFFSSKKNRFRQKLIFVREQEKIENIFEQYFWDFENFHPQKLQRGTLWDFDLRKVI